jgi:hypothetical protein
MEEYLLALREFCPTTDSFGEGTYRSVQIYKSRTASTERERALKKTG